MGGIRKRIQKSLRGGLRKCIRYLLGKQTASPNWYAGLIATAREFGYKTFLDTSGEPLRLALAERPHFVKPNREETAQLLRKPVGSLSDAVYALRKLLSLGAESAALSLGSEGLLFCAGVDTPVLFAPAIPLQSRSTVGCGDSAMAGFAFGIVGNGHLKIHYGLRQPAAGPIAWPILRAPQTKRYSRLSATDFGANA